MIAPPAAKADSFARAIRTDISSAFYTCGPFRVGNSCRQHAPVGAKGQREVKVSIALTLFLPSGFGI
jgi:hypothetical protein